MAPKPFTLARAADFVGREIGTSDWLTVTQARIDTFAQATDDHYWIHTDPVRAAAGAFGAPIAHGFLSLSLLVPLLYALGVRPDDDWTGINYGLDRVRFLAPVPAGARVRGRFVLDAVEEKGPGRIVLHQDASMEIEGAEKPALVARWLNMYVRNGGA